MDWLQQLRERLAIFWVNRSGICHDEEAWKRSVLVGRGEGEQEFCFGHVKLVMSVGSPSGYHVDIWIYRSGVVM